MRAKYILILLAAIMILVASCVKPPEYPVEPFIEFVNMSGNEFDALDEDSLSITFYFEDGDGDLGSEDSINMFWEDSRALGSPNQFKIPFIELQGNSKAISGNVTAYIPIGVCYDFSSVIETYHYNIYIKDRAGNVSNILNTPDITLNCN